MNAFLGLSFQPGQLLHRSTFEIPVRSFGGDVEDVLQINVGGWTQKIIEEHARVPVLVAVHLQQ